MKTWSVCFFLAILSGCTLGSGVSLDDIARNDTKPLPTPSPNTNQPTVAKRIFASNPVHADFGSIAAADAVCNSDSHRPNASTYKAMVVLAGVRSAGQGVMASQIDWVLHPNTDYLRVDGTTPIATTNASAVFDFSAIQNSVTGSPDEAYTGLNTDWSEVDSAHNCSNWTSQTGLSTCGIGVAANVAMININSTRVCSNAYTLYCVEQ